MHAPRSRTAAILLAIVVAGSTLVVGPVMPATAEPSSTYVVRDGDTLSEIADRTGSTTDQLAAANGIVDANLILSGRRLTVPGTTSGPAATSTATATDEIHVVRPGDSLWAIARRYGVTVAALAEANGGTARSVIHAGDRLRIPATSVPSGLVRTGRISMRPTFVKWARANAIDPALLQAVCYLESGWQDHVVSHAGAVGVCQLMPSAVDFAEQLIGEDLDARVADDNIRMSARTLRWLLDQTGGNTRQALAAYYQGLAALRRSGPYPETVQYVNAVQALVDRF